MLNIFKSQAQKDAEKAEARRQREIASLEREHAIGRSSVYTRERLAQLRGERAGSTMSADDNNDAAWGGRWAR